MSKGTLFLLPCYLGEESFRTIFSEQIKEIVTQTTYYVVEKQKSARRYLKFIHPEINQNSLQLFDLDKDTAYTELQHIVQPLLEGNDMAYLSEAGLPCVADPGNVLVALCHSLKIDVVPISGPSSIFLALMASGFNGQQFCFHGYLPIEKQEKRQKLKYIEKLSSNEGSSHIFMETPYRNNALLDDILHVCAKDTMLCIASDITLPSEIIQSKSIAQWNAEKPDLHKKPTIFVLQVP